MLLLFLILLVSSCSLIDVKQDQNIYFEDIQLQLLSDSVVELKAYSTSGLKVYFQSSNTDIATIKDNMAFFHKEGAITISALQDGDAIYYEAPVVSRQLIIKDWSNCCTNFS